MSIPQNIAIEGPIGVGKTSLARIIAQETGARLILEQPEENPFLPDFYKDPEKWALQTQISFLISRHRQQAAIKQGNLFFRKTVSDYIFEKSDIFAQITLTNRELTLYRSLAEILRSEIVHPDLVIYLQSSSQRLLTNIKIRDISYEKSISMEYLESLNKIYLNLFKYWDKCNLLIVKSSTVDFVNCSDHREKLLDSIANLKSGTETFKLEER